jgi:seryl-tRNA synthetase
MIAKTQGSPEEGKRIKEELKAIEPEIEHIEKDYKFLLWSIPNIIASDVPKGKDESENVVIRSWGEKPSFEFEPKDHLALGEALGLIDTKKAGEIVASRFAYLMGDLARLEFSIVQFVFDTLTNPTVLAELAEKISPSFSSSPFIPVVPPVMIRPEVMEKMARLYPKEERYYIPQSELYLVGSAEHTLGPLHMNETLAEERLPIRYIGFSSAFREEAGSYGKDTKGILRMHQFDKLEIESFCLPEDSIKEQDFIVSLQEYLLQQLQLPYQVVMICTGDMGGPDYRQIDMETWMPGQNKYRETHTSDLMTDYQSRRLNTKVKRVTGESQFVHMNDATAFAIGRIIIAIMENYQQKDGTIRIPDVLQKWMGKSVIS